MFARLLDQITTAPATRAGIDAAAGGAVLAGMDDQRPGPDDDAEASGVAHGDGPDVEPIYRPARELIDETHVAAVLVAVRSILLGVPVPAASVAVRQSTSALTAFQLVPASAGRPRTVKLRNSHASASVFLSPDYRQDTTGYELVAGGELVTTTAGPIYVYAVDAGVYVSAWVDHYAAPVTDQ